MYIKPLELPIRIEELVDVCWKYRISKIMLYILCFFTGNIPCIMEGSCAGSSLTQALVVHTWPTPFCLHPSLLSPMIILTTRSCPLHAHLWWASTSPFQAHMQVLCKLEWSTPSQQMSVKGRCLWGHPMGWPTRGAEAWSDLMFFQRYKGGQQPHCDTFIKLFSPLKKFSP